MHNHDHYAWYYRTDTPTFGFVVLNRLNSGNILQFVIPGMEFKIQDSFIMYKSSGKKSDKRP